ncbi:hydroxymethylbilane synthase [Rhodothermus marinus]|jgi:hydroxymethylbilane synthase|uniref:Porphobilinogen deaminase n=1 Tax=Rhodothermus marinus (strain ATCC 43812 / DSM 4252 / R-10) TaxID=518766 RepID=D0MJW6_RHOM4|nr:hydroxymethylbilane synthase [Rhodothermus marinus]ACY48774.1 porphobilinogen deaminase [Rhodothermus marinus DSM 4252]MBO2491623.1 hydroxymethylbilane synthase [Rhodothermus marinus]
MPEPTLILGTRGSALALRQATLIRSFLEARGVSVQVEIIRTTGDHIQDVPLAKIGAKGLFTKELDQALLEGRIDLAVHSLKDLPTEMPEGLVVAAVPERAPPWDVFVAHPDFAGRLEDLPTGAVVATSSLRRQAQLRAWRSDLQVVPVRGNVDTRLRKLEAEGWHGLILAEAGLQRLGLLERVRQRIAPEILLPAVGQGALGVVCAEANRRVRALLQALHHAPTAAAVRAERALLHALQGGCQVPVAALAAVEADGTLVLRGRVVSLDGRQLVEGVQRGAMAEPEAVGEALAETLLQQGARAILEEIRGQHP